MSVSNYHTLHVVHAVVEICETLAVFSLNSWWHISCKGLEIRQLQPFSM